MTEQEIRDSRLMNIKLDEQIDAQLDKKIALQQSMQRARKQIARTIGKTNTYLVDASNLLKDKLTAVRSMNHELSRLDKER